MVVAQLAHRGIQDRYVIAAMGKIPGEAFVAAALEEFAYADVPLPIGEEQTISQPYVVALMIEAAAVRPGDRVLEVGAVGLCRGRSQPDCARGLRNRAPSLAGPSRPRAVRSAWLR